MYVTGLCSLAQSFMEVNYKISSSEWSGTGLCVILRCQRRHNSWKVHLQKILGLDEAKFGLLNHSAMVCSLGGVVLEFTVLALLNLLQLWPTKNGQLHSLVPEQGLAVGGVTANVVLCRGARAGCRVLWWAQGWRSCFITWRWSINSITER